MDVLYGSLEINKLQLLIKKKYQIFFQLLIFVNFWSSKTPDPDSDRYSTYIAGSGSGINEYGSGINESGSENTVRNTSNLDNF